MVYRCEAPKGLYANMYKYDMTENEKRAFKKEQRIREIIHETALNGEWIPIPEKFYSGGEIGFDAAGVSVRAIITFDNYEVIVTMTSPAKCTGHEEVYYRQQTFFRRNPPGASLFVNGEEGGPATKECLFHAKRVLIGMYADWLILYSRKEEIKRKFSDFATYINSFYEKEKERISELREMIYELSVRSGRLKRSFKSGELKQKEYVEQKQPIHKEIVKLMGESVVGDPFETRFAPELEDISYVMDKKKFIETISAE